MNAIVMEVSKDVQPDRVPHGEYCGHWSGYEVKVYIGGAMHTLRTNVGVRGINVPCRISVSETGITVVAVKA